MPYPSYRLGSGQGATGTGGLRNMFRGNGMVDFFYFSQVALSKSAFDYTDRKGDPTRFPDGWVFDFRTNRSELSISGGDGLTNPAQILRSFIIAWDSSESAGYRFWGPFHTDQSGFAFNGNTYGRQVPFAFFPGGNFFGGDGDYLNKSSRMLLQLSFAHARNVLDVTNTHQWSTNPYMTVFNPFAIFNDTILTGARLAPIVPSDPRTRVARTLHCRMQGDGENRFVMSSPDNDYRSSSDAIPLPTQALGLDYTMHWQIETLENQRYRVKLTSGRCDWEATGTERFDSGWRSMGSNINRDYFNYRAFGFGASHGTKTTIPRIHGFRVTRDNLYA